MILTIAKSLQTGFKNNKKTERTSSENYTNFKMVNKFY